jgi:TolB-like protein
MGATRGTRWVAAAGLTVCVAVGACGGESARRDSNLRDASPRDSATPAQVATAGATDSVDLGIQRVGRTLAPAGTGKTVAVLRFPDLENQLTQLGKSVAERLTTVIVQQLGDKGAVVERTQVEQVLEELNLLGEISTRDAATAGQQLGADVVVVGTTSVLDGRVVVNARAVSAADGRVLAADGFTARAGQQVDTRPVGPSPPAAVRITSPVDSLLKLPPVQTAQIGPVQVHAHGCARTGRNVVCPLTFTSLDIDAVSDIWESSSGVSDDRGNTVGMEDVVFGRERQGERGVLIAGIPTPVVVTSAGIPYSAETISRLALRVWVRPDGQREIEEYAVFRSLPIYRP